ncbi:MAG: hypothetical protein R3B67_14435 [Phycisphaerales bacterium]
MLYQLVSNFIRDVRRIAILGADPDRSVVCSQAFEPGALVLGEASRVDLDSFDGLAQRAVPLEVGDELLVADRLA